MSKTIFKPCSYIELNTQHPNPILKITIYCAKCTQNATILYIFGKISKNSKNNILVCILYNFHNSSFDFFVNFVIVGFFILLYILMAPPWGSSTPRAPKELFQKFRKSNMVTKQEFFLRISTIFCMREAVIISNGSRILPCPLGP